MDRLLSRKEAAEVLSLKPKTLANWHTLGVGPVAVRVSPGRIAYEPHVLQAWIAAHRRHSTSDK